MSKEALENLEPTEQMSETSLETELTRFADLNEGFDEFKKLCLSQNLSQDKKKKLISTFHAYQELNFKAIKDYFSSEIGYPLNLQDLDRFFLKFPIENKKEVKTSDQILAETFRNVSAFKSKIAWDKIDVNKYDRIKKLKEILERFSQEPNNFNLIIELRQETDNTPDEEFMELMKYVRGSDVSTYEQFKNIYIEVSQNKDVARYKFSLFEARFPLQVVSIDHPSVVERERIIAAVGEAPQRRGNLLEKTEDGKTVSYNVSTGERYLSIPGSTYMMKTELPDSLVIPIKIKYEPQIQSLESQISSLDFALKEIQKMDSLDDFRSFLRSQRTQELSNNNSQIYSQLKNIFGFSESPSGDFIFPSTLQSLQDIKTKVQTGLSLKQEEIREIKQNYSLELSSIREKYKLKMREKDAKIKDLLSFFHSIGFDLDILPKSLTDSIIHEVQAGGVLTQFGFGKKIDISNGILGIDDGLYGLGDTEKAGFIRFFNKMITGDMNRPIQINAGNILLQVRGQPTVSFNRDSFRAFLLNGTNLFQNRIFNRRNAIANIRNTISVSEH